MPRLRQDDLAQTWSIDRIGATLRLRIEDDGDPPIERHRQFRTEADAESEMDRFIAEQLAAGFFEDGHQTEAVPQPPVALASARRACGQDPSLLRLFNRERLSFALSRPGAGAITRWKQLRSHVESSGYWPLLLGDMRGIDPRRARRRRQEPRQDDVTHLDVVAMSTWFQASDVRPQRPRRPRPSPSASSS